MVGGGIRIVAVLLLVGLFVVYTESRRQHRRIEDERESRKPGRRHHRFHHDQHGKMPESTRRHRKWSHWRPGRFEIGIGHSPEDSWFNFDLDLGHLFGRDTRHWWRGPNVCVSRKESEKNGTDNGEIRRHTSVHSKICDVTDTVYKCITTIDIFGKRKRFTEIKECCHGFIREIGEAGCTKELHLKDLVQTAKDMELTEFVRAIDSVGLAPELEEGNFTIFAPVDQAFQDQPNIIPEFPDGRVQDMPISNLVLVSRPLTDLLVSDMKNLLLGHMLAGTMKTSQLKDDQVLITGSPIKSTIRINFYDYPHKVVTANCARLLKTDSPATNGVIHTVERILSPVTDTLMDLISKNPDLSIMKTLLSKAGLVQKLRKDGQYTLFSPTDAAFEKLPMELRNKLLKGNACLKNILLHHLLPNVICSAVIDKRARSPNMLDRYMSLTRDTNDKIFADGVQVIGTDLMGTNGVLHLVDEVIIPEDALSVVEVADKNGASEVVRLLQSAQLDVKLGKLENLTVFAPSDEAFRDLNPDILAAIESDPEMLRNVLTFHLAGSKLPMSTLQNGNMVESLNSGKKIRVNEYSSFPFGNSWVKTAQCAPIVKHSLKACNGLVHIIDKVMLPPKGDILDVLHLEPSFNTLVRLLKITGLAESLQGEGPFTVFAPPNEAFEDLGEMENDVELMTTILQNHIVKDTVCCAGIFKGRWFIRQQVRVLSGETFPINRQRDFKPTVGEAYIRSCDLMATNGVVQAIDRVLLKNHQLSGGERATDKPERDSEKRYGYHSRPGSFLDGWDDFLSRFQFH